MTEPSTNGGGISCKSCGGNGGSSINADGLVSPTECGDCGTMANFLPWHCISRMKDPRDTELTALRDALTAVTKEKDEQARWAMDCVHEGMKARKERDAAYNDLRVAGYDRDQARQDLERVGRERAEARAKPDADLLQSWADRMAAGVLLACDCGMLDQRSAAADALLCWAALRFDCVAHEALGKLRDLSAAWSKYP